MGGELPKIVRQLGAAPTAETPAKMPGRLQAPDLSSLLGRLEDKVKSDPANIGNRLLLAQTYNELGLGDKALNEVRAALVQAPDHARAQLVLASILSSRQNEADLNEAKALLDSLKLNVKIKQYLVAMYLGDASIRLGEHDEALKNWQQALETMPPTDNRRAQIEKRIADMSAASSKSSD
jgi:cytochrome c-type biogenesis protein CcmH/NrfG